MKPIVRDFPLTSVLCVMMTCLAVANVPLLGKAARREAEELLT